MRAIIVAQQRRRIDHQKGSIFYVRDRLVDQKKIDRFARRKDMDHGTLSLAYSPIDGIIS